ncbi:MAG: SCP2 sterol-binding domain-containing protein [Proteobacteria bacterium]|nr:SCP2 sterol-binding domain-containing protein [Pseudomonadota bacterium]MBU1569766.1 SCP2 sterol-binding domain-containing protein [Pseudomonadota bacterium]
MEYWKDENEPIKAFVKLFEAAMVDAELTGGLKKVNQLILFDYTEDGPNCSFWVDCRKGELKVGPGKPAEPPDMTMSLSADDAHRSWSNKLNPVMAITRKKIRVKGSATGLLKLAPKLKKVAAIYVTVLKDLGWEDKILA